MARHLYVYRREGLELLKSPPGDSNSAESDRWSAELRRTCLYEGPLGGEGAVRTSWSAPAEALGLPLLASIYERGFVEGIEWSGPQLPQLAAELRILERHRHAQGLAPEVAGNLRERSALLFVAICVALQTDGVILIA